MKESHYNNPSIKLMSPLAVCWTKFVAGCKGVGAGLPLLPEPDLDVVGGGDCCTCTTGAADWGDCVDTLLPTFRRTSATA